jgi:hypothetical protein
MLELGVSMSNSWTFEDYKENFFFHTKVENDIFSEIEKLSIVTSRSALRDEFLAEARTVFEVSSLPFFVAFLAAGTSHIKLLESLLKKAKDENCKKSHEVAMFILEDQLYTTAIDAVIPTFEKLHEVGLMKEQLEKLNNSIVMSAYGVLEKYSKFVLRSILLENLYAGLDLLESKSLKIAKSSPSKLKNRIDADERDPLNSLSQCDLYDENILNKGYLVEQYTELFGALYDFQPQPSVVSQLKKMESLRHILIHRNGVVDKKYIDEIDNSLNVGDKVKLSPNDLKEFMGSFGSYFKSLLSISQRKF